MPFWRSTGTPLRQLDVLVLDCQATAAAPRGHLIELGWARAGATCGPPRTCLVRLPGHARVPPAVARVTGISDRSLREGIEPPVAWAALRSEAAALPEQPAPAVVHFARFERGFLQASAGGAPPLDLVCTREIARRLLPRLPRCSLRALAGYFGRAVGPLRRSGDHVAATAFVWSELVPLLEAQGVDSWCALHEWLTAPAAVRPRAARAWPMPRDLRLALPDTPGIYRMLRTNGDVLYVGKAASLHARVNSYFRKQHGVPERLLEMLSQARALSFEVTPSTLEAALLEPDEIKRHRPPYNVALTEDDRTVWFASPDLRERGLRPSRRCCAGPFPSGELLDQFGALSRRERTALASGRPGPEETVFRAGCARLWAAHGELTRAGVQTHTALLRLGARLWREGRRDRDAEPEPEEGELFFRVAPDWTPESVQHSLERLALRAALALRRARWLTQVFESAIVWSEAALDDARLLVVECGEIVRRDRVAKNTTPPVPPGCRQPAAARRDAFTLARFDRVRVLTTELKRLAGEGQPVAVRFGPGSALAGDRLCRALSWV